MFLMCLLASTALSMESLEEAQAWRQSQDPVARLWQKLESGQVTLDVSTEQTFLQGLLRHLDIPAESQVLVFSKTSLQKQGISPATPRAIYFNEETYLGWVRGGDLEVVTAAPGQEFQYYLIRRIPARPSRQPALVKSGQCLSCHVGGDLQLQSVYTRADGSPMGQEDRFTTTYESPLSERWGGWYVTGQHGSDLHMGNVTASMGARGSAQLDRQKGANVTDLGQWLDTAPYPVKTSDIAALLVLEHQYVLHNALQEAGRAVRRLEAQVSKDSRTTGQMEASLKRGLTKRAQAVADLLLFSDEYPLKEGVQGSPDFQKAFQRNGRTTSQGRSLKDFDLQTHLFKYRCSYMIHSPAFKGLPVALKNEIYDLLGQRLGPHTNDSPLPASERETLRQILQETEPEIAVRWQSQQP